MSYMFQNYVSASCLSINLPNIITANYFFPFHCVFQGLSAGKRIGSGYEQEGMYYLDDIVNLTVLVVDQPDHVLLWHCRLGHPSVQKLSFLLRLLFL